MKGLKPGAPIFTVNGVSRKFGDREVLKSCTFSLYPGDRVGIVGVNGAGKSTLMRIIAQADDGFDGVAVPAKGLTVGYVPQEPQLDLDKTVIAKAAMLAFGPRLHQEGMLNRWLVARALWGQMVFRYLGADEGG